MSLVAALGLLAVGGCALGATRGERGARERLTGAIDRALAAPAMDGVGAAVLVVSLDRGDTLYARQADRLYTPASNLKLFTSASAYRWLGPDYRFTTALLATGPVRGDTLRGDVVLVGRGDPDLVTADLAALADTLAGRGVRVVTGDVRADASWFDDVEWGSGWMWDDGPFWYWPYVSALTLDDNTVKVVVRPGAAPGDTVRVALEPPTAYVRVRVTATTVGRGEPDSLEVVRHWVPVKENAVDVGGTLPLGADSIVAERTVEDPALFAATVLDELLAARGVEVLGAPVRRPLAGAAADTVAVHVSPPLAESVHNLLKISDNLTAEQLVKVVGAETAGPPGSYEKGLHAERLFLSREVGLDTLRIHLADGSGVSRYNLVTARQIVRLLGWMARREDLFESWFAGLPVAGEDGTLEDRMGGSAAEGRVHAKTGSLSGVSSLSGYATAADGERLAFSTIMEFFTGPTGPRRAVQDSIAAALGRFSR